MEDITEINNRTSTSINQENDMIKIHNEKEESEKISEEYQYLNLVLFFLFSPPPLVDDLQVDLN